MSKISFKPGTMPVVMVSCGTMEDPNIITAAWTGIVNSDPPMTYVSIRPERYSHDIIENTGEFAINLCTRDLARVTDLCGVRSGRQIDKFLETGLTREPGEHISSPLIAESPVNLECRVVDKREYGSHDMFVAEIVGVHVDDKLLDENGRLALDRAGLVAYCHGEYIPLADNPIGSFGYSVMKKKTMKRRAREGKPVYRK